MKYSLMMAALALTLSACSKEEVAAAKVERLASTYLVGALGADSGHVYSGEVRAQHEVALGFRVGGKMIERRVEAGTQVKAGQVLARIDAADAGLQESAASAQLKLAGEDLKRYRELREKNFVSQSALDAKETAYKAAEAQAGLSRNQSSYTQLVADRAGVVAATLAEVGQVVSAGQAVVRVAQEGPREVAVAIPEVYFSGLKLGMTAEVEVSGEDNSSRRVVGRLRELSPAADAISRTYPARIALPKSEALALGMTARVRFVSSEKKTGYLVPLSAIFQQGEQAAVWVVAADRSVALHPVKVAAYRDDGALIASGLAVGERIVSAGVHKLTVGDKVRLMEQGATQ